MSVCGCPLGSVCQCGGLTPDRARIAELEAENAKLRRIAQDVVDNAWPGLVDRARALGFKVTGS